MLSTSWFLARPTPLHESSDQAATSHELRKPVLQWPPVQLSRREELAGLVPEDVSYNNKQRSMWSQQFFLGLQIPDLGGYSRFAGLPV